uniref:hypothetical protein n=1 Tax=Paracoccus marcusii TaxID=59779 RepID=UPI0024936632
GGRLLRRPQQDHPAATVADFCTAVLTRRLRTNQQTLHYLASQGLLSLNRRRHPVTRSMRWYVERYSLEHFMKRFVTVGMLATELGDRPGPLSKRLEALGIRPIYSVPNVSRVYYISVVREMLKMRDILQKSSPGIDRYSG